jgi:formyl-CoA transferase
VDKAEFFRDARRDLPGPLHGTRVIEMTRAWAGPMAGCVLADLGADVVRIELPGNREGQMAPEIPGTGLSWFRETVHRNKRSASLDVRVPEGRELYLDLVRTCDILIENFKPGTLDGWGVGYQDCRQVRPGLVYVSISGWGQYGPQAGQPGYDPVAQASSGWMSLNGNPDGEPTKAPTFVADDVAGLHAAIAALAALRHRDQTGEGQQADVSLLDCLLFQSNGFLTLAAGQVPLNRRGNETDFFVPCDTYACADGGHVYITVALDKHWRLLAEAAGRPDLAAAPGFASNRQRVANRDQVNAIVAQWCAQRPVAEVIAALDHRGVTVARVRDFGAAATDPHVLARDMLQETTLCNGSSAPLTGPAVKFSRTPVRVRRGAPAVGADTDEILDGAGVDAARRAQLREAGVI